MVDPVINTFVMHRFVNKFVGKSFKFPISMLTADNDKLIVIIFFFVSFFHSSVIEIICVRFFFK